MRAPPCRRFEIADAMILIAAVSLGCYFFREAILLQLRQEMANSTFYIGGWIRRWAPPILVPLTLAALAIRLRSPRPPLRRLFRQPGALASLLVAASIGLTVLLPLIRLAIYGPGAFSGGYPSIRRQDLFAIIFYQSASLIMGSWLTLALSRSFRPEPEWVDRLGTTIGTAWIVLWFLQVFGDSLL